MTTKTKVPASPQYEIAIWWSDKDHCFVASVPDLPGCMAHGDTPQEALREILVAQKGWLAACRKFGDLIPAPTSRLSRAAGA